MYRLQRPYRPSCLRHLSNYTAKSSKCMSSMSSHNLFNDFPTGTIKVSGLQIASNASSGSLTPVTISSVAETGDRKLSATAHAPVTSRTNDDALATRLSKTMSLSWKEAEESIEVAAKPIWSISFEKAETASECIWLHWKTLNGWGAISLSKEQPVKLASKSSQ